MGRLSNNWPPKSKRTWNQEEYPGPSPMGILRATVESIVGDLVRPHVANRTATIGHCKGPTQDLQLRRSYVSVSERVAIAGVTGYIGGRLAPRLLEHGYAIRCLVRSPAKLQNRSWVTDPNVQI